MPGFDSNRFVDLSENEKSELTCSICQDILRCPVVTRCCLQSFCDDCINNWLVNHNTCPYDRKTLTNRQLSRAPRAMINLLGKLRIRCNFSDNGCNEVVVLENLSNHLQRCQYNHNIKECVRCLCNNRTANHNCVEYLLDTNTKITIDANQLMERNNELVATNRNMSIELSQLKRSYKELAKKSNLIGRYNETQVYMSRQIDKLKKEKENLMKIIAELENQVKPEPSTTIFPSLVSNNISSFNETDTKVEAANVHLSSEMRRHDVVNTTAHQALREYDNMSARQQCNDATTSGGVDMSKLLLSLKIISSHNTQFR